MSRIKFDSNTIIVELAQETRDDVRFLIIWMKFQQQILQWE